MKQPANNRGLFLLFDIVAAAVRQKHHAVDLYRGLCSGHS